jgi:uncharacterized protein (TIGR02594 family)
MTSNRNDMTPNLNDILNIQRLLATLGHYRGSIDGLFGPMSRAALAAALEAFSQGANEPDPPPPVAALPWMVEGMVPYGWHEVRDNARLRTWLRSDGRTLGDPAALPWCGDYVETAIRRALPLEPLPGALGQNPYWARNWMLFGRATQPTYGCVLVFSRGSGGHVGFAVGHDATAFHVLGGNQSNAVNVTRIAKDRLLGARWPSTVATRPINLPTRAVGNLTLSINEV